MLFKYAITPPTRTGCLFCRHAQRAPIQWSCLWVLASSSYILVLRWSATRFLLSPATLSFWGCLHLSLWSSHPLWFALFHLLSIVVRWDISDNYNFVLQNWNINQTNYYSSVLTHTKKLCQHRVCGIHDCEGRNRDSNFPLAYRRHSAFGSPIFAFTANVVDDGC